MRTPSTTGEPRAEPNDVDDRPGFIARLTRTDHGVLPGRPVWPDVPWLRVYGRWQGRLHTAAYRDHRLLVLGHCLAEPRQVAERLRAAVDGGSPRALGDLPGAYTVVIVGSGEVTVRTDLAGQFPVYWSTTPGETVLGAHPDMIARLHRRPPDPVTAAARIVCAHVLPLWDRRSAYARIQRLPGQAFVRLGPGGPEPSPPAPALPARSSFRDGAAALRHLLIEAVALRCRAGEIGADLSGGLDSTSVALLCARFSAAPVPVVTYHHPQAPAGDLDEALRVAGPHAGLRHIVVNGTPDTLPFQALPDAPVDPEPAPGAIAWRRSLLRLSRAGHAGPHLTGEGGDAVLSASPAYLADLARPRTARTFARHCRLRASRHDASAVGLATRAVRVSATGGERSLLGLSRTLLRGGGRPLDWPDGVAWWPVSAEAVGWLTPRMRHALAGIAADPATAASIPAGCTAAEMAALTELRHSGDAQRHLRELGHRIGVDVHAPYLDDLVVRGCLRVPPAERENAETSKPLLAAALGGVLPDEVFGRGAKGDYTREEYLGARRAAPALRRLMSGSLLAAHGVLDPDAVLRSIDRLIAGCAVPLGPLRQALATELWLRAGRPS